MDKFVIYCTASDQLMLEGSTPFIGTEKEVKDVLRHEVVDAKRYEIKPISFMKQWAKKIKKQEEEQGRASYRFSPTFPEFHYKALDDQQRYLLILGQEGVRKSGRLVKDFASVEDAVTMGSKSIKKVVQELPDHAYFILDTERYAYVSRLNEKGITHYEFSGLGNSKRKSRSGSAKTDSGAASGKLS